MNGLLDTSVLIAREQGLDAAWPDHGAISVITLAELEVGVLRARSSDVRAERLRSLSRVEQEFDALPVDQTVARRFAQLVAAAREQGRRPRVVDALIAATALAHGLPVYTRDADFDEFVGLATIRS